MEMRPAVVVRAVPARRSPVEPGIGQSSRGNPATYNKGFAASELVTSLARETQAGATARESQADSPALDPPDSDERYSRQILFRGIGAEGQRKLAAARVAIVGCGATGSALAGLLARAGVGTLRIIDRDYVEPSNLQRQSLFDEKDAAESLPKAIAAARKIAAFNSAIVVEPKVEDLVPANIEALLEGMSLILDGTDNFETRYLINDYAVDRSLPWIYSAAVGSYAVTLNSCPEKRPAWPAFSRTRPEAWSRPARLPAF